ncbi:MAG: cation diffusion facilitator family transporter [Lachnospiraceae bacterium]
MTEFLVRLFVKDNQQTYDTQVRTRYGLMASVVGICCNLLLFGAKLCMGILINSISTMADAFNNLSDAASSIIGFVGMKMAQKPADADHPFGHGRIEYISAFIVAFLVIQVGFSLFKTSIGKILHPEELSFRVVSIIVLFLTIGVKLWMALFYRKLGKRIRSKVLLANAADSMGDMAATSATIVSLVAYGVFHVNIDGIVGLAVSVLIMYTGLNIAKDTLAPLIGEGIDPDFYERINNFVERYDGIVGSHDLIVHNYGPNRSMASIHAEVPNDVDVQISHEIIDQIEHDALKQLNLFLVIHMDPVETKDEQVQQLKEMTLEVIAGLDSRLTMHDFRVVEGTSRINLIFDLVIPREYTDQMRDALKEQICQKIKIRDSRCFCVITAECSYRVEA